MDDETQVRIDGERVISALGAKLGDALAQLAIAEETNRALTARIQELQAAADVAAARAVLAPVGA